jgi:hypothetical protein
MVDPDNYEDYVSKKKRGFTRVLAAIALAFVLAIYLPWAFVRPHGFSRSSAEIMSCFSAFLLLCAWVPLTAALSSPPSDARPAAAQLNALLFKQLLAGVALVGVLLVVAVLSFLAGWIELRGIGWSVGLAMMLGMVLGRGLVARAMRGE